MVDYNFLESGDLVSFYEPYTSDLNSSRRFIEGVIIGHSLRDASRDAENPPINPLLYYRREVNKGESGTICVLERNYLEELSSRHLNYYHLREDAELSKEMLESAILYIRTRKNVDGKVKGLETFNINNIEESIEKTLSGF